MAVSTAAKGRHLFIDLYRSAVILLMLEGHTLRTFLSPAVQGGTPFQLHEFFHGLSAPAFLFGAGLTFIISTKKRWEEYHRWGPPLERRLRRLLLILLLGLFLHLPYLSIRKIIIDGTADDYLRLFQFDVLHCIGIGLLVLHALVFLFRSEAHFYGLVLTTITGVCFLTPLVWDVDFLHYVPPAIAQAINGNHGSPFPLFPYVGFLFAGVIVSWEFLLAASRQSERRFMRLLAILGIALIGAGILSDLLPIRIYPTYNYWFTSPSYFILRIGILLLATSGFWHLARIFSWGKRVWTVLGRESLFVYVLHLIVLYGSVLNPESNLRLIVGSRLAGWQAGLVFLVFLAAMLVAASVWNALKERRTNIYRLIQLAGGAVFLYYFFTRDY